ncbi:MAG: hypothetical protein SF029_06175 [bacterium]|nr:hypothetical protein [bacterium]
MSPRNILIVLLFPLLALSLAACGRGDVSIQRNPNGGFDVTATLSEADVNTAITQALAASANPLLREPQVDLQAGRIVVNGQHERRDGGGTVSGSITIVPSVTDGNLTAQITEADLEGWDAADERIAQFNERLSSALAQLAERGRGVITMRAVSVTDNALEIQFTAQRRQ